MTVDPQARGGARPPWRTMPEPPDDEAQTLEWKELSDQFYWYDRAATRSRNAFLLLKIPTLLLGGASPSSLHRVHPPFSPPVLPRRSSRPKAFSNFSSCNPSGSTTGAPPTRCDESPCPTSYGRSPTTIPRPGGRNSPKPPRLSSPARHPIGKVSERKPGTAVRRSISRCTCRTTVH
jgi:hypothetical protein